MSLILDALSRAEREKRGNDGGAPDLLSQPQYAASGPSRHRALLGLGAIGLLFGVAVLVFVYLDRGEPSPASPATAPLTAPVALPRSSPAGPQPAAGTGTAARMPPPLDAPDIATVPPVGAGPVAPESGFAPAEPSAEVQALYTSADSSGTASPPGAVTEEPAAVAATPAADREEDATSTPAVTAPPSGIVEEVVDLETVLREVRSAAERDGLAPHPVPLLAQQSKQFRDRVPTLMYLRHDFNAAGQSTVLINGQTLRVGQRTRGVELREILADSVILRFDGTDFRLRALNSWVNL